MWRIISDCAELIAPRARLDRGWTLGGRSSCARGTLGLTPSQPMISRPPPADNHKALASIKFRDNSIPRLLTRGERLQQSFRQPQQLPHHRPGQRSNGTPATVRAHSARSTLPARLPHRIAHANGLRTESRAARRDVLAGSSCRRAPPSAAAADKKMAIMGGQSRALCGGRRYWGPLEAVTSVGWPSWPLCVSRRARVPRG